MKLADVDLDSLRGFIASAPPTFDTYDVSRDPDVLAAHRATSAERNYNAMIGKALAAHAATLGIRYEGQHGPKGSALWSRMTHAGPDDQTTGDPCADGLGPQYEHDRPFAALMRHHQSWWRARRLEAPCGTDARARARGSMLANEPAGLGANFLAREIFEVALERMSAGGGVERGRTTGNLLSSQPMCINLFAPLVRDRALAARCLRALLAEDIAEVVDVRIEYAPHPREDYLGDHTAFDAFIVYRRSNGDVGFIGCETKLVEQTEGKVHRRDSYDRLTQRAGSPWRIEAWDALWGPSLNQLWRNHLLAEAMLAHPTSEYDEGRFMLIYHPDDLEWAQLSTLYQQTLVNPNAYIEADLGRIHAAWVVAAEWPEHQLWLKSFADRYLRLELSESTT